MCYLSLGMKIAGNYSAEKVYPKIYIFEKLKFVFVLIFITAPAVDQNFLKSAFHSVVTR